MLRRPTFIYIYGGAIGDTLLGVHIGRTLRKNIPDAQLLMISTRKNQFAGELVQSLPFVVYKEMPKNRLSSWFYLCSLMWTPHSIIHGLPSPIWWKIIARLATLRSGSIEVCCHMHDYMMAPARIRLVRYDCRSDNLFSLPAKILNACGIKTAQVFRPYLEAPTDCSTAKQPFILFHFFAASYRRSLPTNHARELLQAARTEFPSHLFILTCSGNERKRAQRIIDGMKNVRIESDLHAQELVCLLMQASVCVGVGSGIMFIAAQLSVPSVIMTNLSDPCWLPTYNPDVSILYERARCGCNGDKTGVCEQMTEDGPVFRCLYDIKTERIIEEMKRQYER